MRTWLAFLSVVAAIGCERPPSRYVDLNALPMSHEAAMAAGATPIQSGDFKPQPGAISISLSPQSALDQRHCQICYVGPCDRDEQNKVRGTYDIGYWEYNDKDKLDPKSIAEIALKRTGHIRTEQDIKQIQVDGWFCDNMRTTDHKRCVPGST